MENDNRRDRLYEIIYKEMVGPEPIDFFMHDVIDSRDNIIGKICEVGSIIVSKDGTVREYGKNLKKTADDDIIQQHWFIYGSDEKCLGYINNNGEAVNFEGKIIGCVKELEDGKEFISEAPHKRYIAGVLFPQDMAWDNHEDEGNEEIEDNSDEVEDQCPIMKESTSQNSRLKDKDDIAEELIDLSNAYKPSAMSLTFSLRQGIKDVDYIVKTAYYTKKKIIFNKYVYERFPLIYTARISLPSEKSRLSFQWLLENKLKLNIVYRYVDKKTGKNVYTATLENCYKAAGDKLSNCEKYFFQTGFLLKNTQGFCSLPDHKRLNVTDEDFQSNQLLYRKVKNYVIGHGCAGDWNDGEIVETIKTTIFPEYEMKPILPKKFDNIDLDMYKMCDKASDFGFIRKNITELCNQYEKWIENRNNELDKLEDIYKATALRHMNACNDCLTRMREGLRLLEEDDIVRDAFMYMNRAILLQQLHYNLPLGEFKEEGTVLKLKNNYKVDISDKSTWIKQYYGKWRPFQLAFILINLKSMRDRECDERKIVDLIWFPTGGGKTEAYLGLSAYTIFVRRLLNKDDAGTSIFMRYTLRLLTAQQFERASAMICACDVIRKEKEDILGNQRITIGLWVGEHSSYNKMGDAVSDIKKMYSGNQENHKFLILKCPWCGAPMGKNHQHEIRKPVTGYEIIGKGASAKAIFQCSNSECAFSKQDNYLPLTVVDEEIYENPPTLLIGTVDKFAILPFKPQARSIFGKGTKFNPPDLIIQDELHLISGPLGSMVGCYETMINELCVTKNNKGKLIEPKIIASTATISKAKEQCRALYNAQNDHVNQFPPSGLDAKDSFFAYEDNNITGRLYVGIFAPAASSSATANIRLFAALLYAAKALKCPLEEADPYWTNMGYFNNLKDLGQAVTWLDGDINEYLHIIYKRNYEDIKEGYKDARRYIYRHEELTSRKDDEEIPYIMRDLARKCTEKDAIDMCLATNMISVGLDISRLGLMSIIGQPKTTAEYIQASSRVGRDSSAPGIVFTLYNTGKSRDKSYYEHFKEYHSKIYSHVEPTSVTPFSAPLRKRAIHAVLVGLSRLLSTNYNNTDEGLEKAEEIKKLILSRIADIEPEEYKDTEIWLDLIINLWRKTGLSKYDNNFQNTTDRTLLIDSGHERPTEFKDDVLPLNTSTNMRSVDAMCDVKVFLFDYPSDNKTKEVLDG